MKCGVIRICTCLLMIAQVAASSSAGNSSQFSGSYELVHKSERGAHAQLTLRIHFTNQGSRTVSIQRLTIGDISSARNGASQACSVLLPAHGSAAIMQEFTVPRSEYVSWAHGNRPRLMLKVRSPGHPDTTEVVHLVRFSNGKEN